MLKRFGCVFAVVLLAAHLVQAQDTIKVQRVYSAGHSFHVFMPGILADISKKAKIEDRRRRDPLREGSCFHDTDRFRNRTEFAAQPS